LRHEGRNGLSEITPYKQDGVVPPTPDYQYSEGFSPNKPLIEQQMHDEDDLRNVYNPNKLNNWWPSSGMDIRFQGRNGLAQVTDDAKTEAKTEKKAEAKTEAKTEAKDAKPAKKTAKAAAGGDKKDEKAAVFDASKIGCQFKAPAEHYGQPLTDDEHSNCTGFKIKNQPSLSSDGWIPNKSLAQVQGEPLPKPE